MNLYKLSFVGDDPYGYRYTCVVCAQDAEEAKNFSDSLYWDEDVYKIQPVESSTMPVLPPAL